MQKIIGAWQGRKQKYIHKYSEIINDLYFSIYTAFYKNEKIINDLYFSIYTSFYKNEEFKIIVYVSRNGFYSNKQERLCKYILDGYKYFLTKLDINDFLSENEMNNEIIRKEFNKAMLSNVKDLSLYFGL